MRAKSVVGRRGAVAPITAIRTTIQLRTLVSYWDRFRGAIPTKRDKIADYRDSIAARKPVITRKKGRSGRASRPIPVATAIALAKPG
ncbi:hypothetical protein [[Phormidium] sp. ETS-05]|uniref:hypothetical protein n=1 Tax=[Phormidium] sp. ETS-05 TaxID=222819 RepID=UPI0018EEDE72|nr:hypothetical protein [[Phormidium] sp. ETS-05]